MSGVRAQDAGEDELIRLRKKNKALKHTIRRMRRREEEGVRYGDITIFISPQGNHITVNVKKRKFEVERVEHAGKHTQVHLRKVEVAEVQETPDEVLDKAW